MPGHLSKLSDDSYIWACSVALGRLFKTKTGMGLGMLELRECIRNHLKGIKANMKSHCVRELNSQRISKLSM